MSRPDVMDRDVAALLGLDAAAFAEAPRPVRKAPARPAWMRYGAPVAIALIVGAGLGLMRLSGDRSRPEQRAPAAPPAPAAAGPRVMSLQVRKVERPRPAPVEARRAADFDPTAPAEGAAPAALAFAESAGPAPADHAPEPQTLEVTAFSMLSDKEIDPTVSPAAAEPHAHAAPSPDAEPPAPSP
jgi:hypothetical protein